MEEARRFDLVQLCQELIRQPSPSGREDRMAELIKSVMLPLGFDVEVDRYGNVLGTITFNKAGPTLLYEAQMDHADTGDLALWSCYPFGGTIVGDRIYGRGSTDQKGILAAMILASFWLRHDLGSSLKGRLVIAATVHQETFESAVSRLVAERVKPDFVVSGEASSLAIERGQRGRASVVFDSFGKMVHSSISRYGLNAAEQMVQFIHSLNSLYRRRCDPFFGDNSMTLTDIVSYPRESSSALPSHCRAIFDRRLLQGEDHDSILEELNLLVQEISKSMEGLNIRSNIERGDGKCYTGAMIEADRFAPAWELSRDHPLIDKALDGIGYVGIEPILSDRAGFGTNGCVYGGELKIPTVVFGPSSRELAHVVDEYINIEQLVLGCQGYYGIARSILS